MSGRQTRTQSRKKAHQLTKIAKLEQELAKAKPSANNYRDFLQRRIAELKSKQPSLKQELGIASSEGFGTKNLLGSTTYNNQSLKPVVSYGPNKDIFRDRKLDPDLSFTNRANLAIQEEQITTPLPQTGTVAGIVRGSDQDYGQNPDGSDRREPSPSKQIEMQKRSSLAIDPATNNVFTIDPATGKQVGVITRNQRRKLQERLNAKAGDG